MAKKMTKKSKPKVPTSQGKGVAKKKIKYTKGKYI